MSNWAVRLHPLASVLVHADVGINFEARYPTVSGFTTGRLDDSSPTVAVILGGLAACAGRGKARTSPAIEHSISTAPKRFIE